MTEQLRWFKAQDLVKGDADADRGDRHAVPADAMSDGLRLALRGVCHAYRDLSVLQDIDLVAEPGEVLVLVGPSGCGKSTLLGIMGGMLAPTAGTVRVEGAVADDCLNPLTYVFQDFALLPWRSVAGNVSLVLEATPAARRTRGAGRRGAGADRADGIRRAPGRGSFPAACASASASRARWRCVRRAC